MIKNLASNFFITTGRKKSRLIVLIIVFSVYSCIETFFPVLPNKSGFLVVDAMVTDEARSYDVYLTRSISALNSKVTNVKGAYVSISDNSGKEFVLQEISAGHYITDSKKFTGQVGNEYTLYIRIAGVGEYRSDICKMYGTSEIEQIYFGKNIKFTENGVAENTGLSIYLDGKVSDKTNCYLRWELNEVWKFAVYYPPFYSFSPPNIFTPIAIKNQYCWKSAKSTDILIHSFRDQATGNVKSMELAFLITNESDRFNSRYSVSVNQYTISQVEYEFWNKLKSTNEQGGGIFERQPYSISGNIKNLTNPDEVVLGYFQVSGVSSKRIYINPLEIVNLNLPLISNNCTTKDYQLGDMGESKPFTSLNEIYLYLTTRDSVLVIPYYNDRGILAGMTATSKRCSDCSITGNPNRPSFWID